MINVKTLIIAIILIPSLASAENGNLFKNDASLISHVKKTDYIFTTALGKCNSEKLLRNIGNNKKQFKYIAICAAKAAKESDCPEYKVKAIGTIDTNSWATIREIKLVLQCYG